MLWSACPRLPELTLRSHTRVIAEGWANGTGTEASPRGQTVSPVPEAASFAHPWTAAQACTHHKVGQGVYTWWLLVRRRGVGGVGGARDEAGPGRSWSWGRGGGGRPQARPGELYLLRLPLLVTPIFLSLPGFTLKISIWTPGDSPWPSNTLH